ncbi:MAG: lysine transporter LysE [Flavobacteriales bacterium CG_4_9_14_3_um_filter_40_17]|nr:MAG: lysine transporter LysE [Flavobacteriales bacterium CG_4_9_14_3_um_filter_40_17]
MNFIWHLVLGIILSGIGVIPPGMLNMNVAKITIKDGKSRALMFALGASLVVSIQSTIGLFFAKFLNSRTDWVDNLQRFGLLILVILAIYFLTVASYQKKKPKSKLVRSKRSRFLLGIFLSVVNVFPIPFYAFISVTMASFSWFLFEQPNTAAFVVGTSIGTFLMLYVYILFAKNIASKSERFIKNMNLIIGIIAALAALITLFKLL